MRFSYASVIFFAGSVLAITEHECLVNNSKDLAAFTECGQEDAIANCLGQLQNSEHSHVKTCYTQAGCSAAEAEIEVQHTLIRCDGKNRMGDLKKRFRGMAMPRAAASTTAAAASTNTFGFRTGADCFTTGKHSTTSCPLSTSAGHVLTVTCFPTEVSTSQCAPNLLCTVDSSNNDICMDLHSGLDTSGIIILIIFGIVIALGIGSLTFLCCKDRKEQRRLVAKAEAKSLARAATKKQRASERAPMIRHASGGPNPFQDESRI